MNSLAVRGRNAPSPPLASSYASSPAAPKRSASAAGGSAANSPSVCTPETFERLGQLGQRSPRAQERNRQRSEIFARLLAVAGDDLWPAHPRPSGRCHGCESRRGDAEARRHSQSPSGSFQHSLDPLTITKGVSAIQPEQSTRIETNEPRAFRLDRRSDRLEAYEQPLPGVGHAGGVGCDQRETRAAGERLAEGDPRMDAERLRRE